MIERYQVVIIGAGPGGYVAAIRAAQLGLKVACIEQDPFLGGTCLNVGCIPSKTLLQISEHYAWFEKQAEAVGIKAEGLDFDFDKMLNKKIEVINSFRQGIKALFKKNKVTLFQGKAKVATDHIVEVRDVEGKMTPILSDYVVLATGSRPIELPFLPFDEKVVVSSTGALSLKAPPKKLLVIGGGVIGLELASVYQRLGSEVVIIEMLDSICAGMDEDICKEMEKTLVKQGLKIHTSTKVVSASKTAKGVTLEIEKGSDTHKVSGDICLVAVGRKPYTEDLGVKELGVEVNATGHVVVDVNFRSNIRHIFAIGDVIQGPMLAHRASEEGIAVAEMLYGMRPHINYMAIPSVIYTHPEAASVGMTQKEAKRFKMHVKSAKFPFKANSRARCIGDDGGFVKVIQDKASKRVVGMHIIGPQAGELIQCGVLAIEKKATVHEMSHAPYAHPTLTEAVKEACLAIEDGPIHM